jgi:hypothetical protein
MDIYLVGFAYFCLSYNTLYVTYALYNQFFGSQPVTFLELWHYFEDRFEKIRVVVEEENKETRKKMVDSLFNSEARSFEKFKETLKKWKDEQSKN